MVNSQKFVEKQKTWLSSNNTTICVGYPEAPNSSLGVAITLIKEVDAEALNGNTGAVVTIERRRWVLCART